MAKISRPAVYTFVGAVAVYAVVLLTQPDPPASPRKIHVARRAPAEASDFTQDDLNAHFARYGGGKRNPFLSGLPPAKPGGAAGAQPGQWTLTGINVLNGVPSALVENGTTGESAFLRAGDRWRGLRVASIGPGAVSFVNALGQRTRLAFRDLDAPVPTPHVTDRGGFRLPPLGTANVTLPPLPIRPENIQPLPPLGSPPAPRGR